ncbi:MAG: CPBP family intramembrane metalloprotease [Bacilli bacterium]|nr:CPBP family intramembrane metalloprotease [Bacilli bacterium]
MLKKINLEIILRSIIVLLIFHYAVYLQLIPVKLLNLDVHSLSKSMLVLLSAFSSISLFIIYFFIYHKDLKKEFKIFMKNPLEKFDIGFKYWMFGLIIMMASNFILTYLLKSDGAANEQAVQSMLKTLPWLMFITAGVIAPFNEEIVFRKTLKDVFKNKWVFAILSFLLFGGAHVMDTAKTIIDVLYIIPYGALGGAFALAYYDTDTIFTPLSLHMMHNIILSILSILVL